MGGPDESQCVVVEDRDGDPNLAVVEAVRDSAAAAPIRY